MKRSSLKITVLIILILAINIFSRAQSPQKMSYQAVVRNSSDQLVVNKKVGIRITILKGTESGIAVYTETQNPTTNANGLVTLEIGSGTTSDNFSSIEWGSDTFFIKTETDPSGGTNYTISGISQLLSVPYALYAKNVENAKGDNWGIQTVVTNGTITGKGTSVTPLKIAQQSATTGQVLKWDGTSWTPGDDERGEGGLTLPYYKSLSSSSDLFVIENSTGNAIYGSATNTSGQNIGVYGISSSDKGAGVKGVSISDNGYGVIARGKKNGSFSIATDTVGNSIGVIGQNYSPNGYGVYGVNQATSGMAYAIFGDSKSSEGYGVAGSGNVGVIGQGATHGLIGESSATDLYGCGVVGKTNSKKGYGVIGFNNATSGNSVGVYGAANSPDGCAIRAMNGSETGKSIAVIGQTMSPNGYSGYFSGPRFYISGRLGIGDTNPGAGLHIKGDDYPNSFIFLEAAATKDAGIRLYEGNTVKWHIFNSASAGGLQIYNNEGKTAIFCKQSNSYVGINTTNPAYNLEVIGSAGKTGGGSWSTSSDIRLKDVTGKYNKGLTEISALQPIVFKYKMGNPRNLTPNEEQIGFIAQDVQKIFPEAVNQSEDGYLDFNIHAINVAMVNAVKELKAENDKLKAENDLLKAANKQFESRLTNLEKLVGTGLKK